MAGVAGSQSRAIGPAVTAVADDSAGCGATDDGVVRALRRTTPMR